MKAVQLTNLGNLTLGNLLQLDEKYAENVGLKRRKLAKLWGSRKTMDRFQSLFSEYHRNISQILVQEGDSYYLVDSRSGKKTQLDLYVAPSINKFERMGLVRKSSNSTSIDDIVSDIETDVHSNPIRSVGNVTIELTGFCNLKCKHCYRGGSRKGEYGLSTSKIKKALKPLLRAGINHIRFTGGEPIVRQKDLLGIVDYASRFLELKGASIGEKLKHKYGTSDPDVEDVLKTENWIRIKRRYMAQLASPRSSIKVGYPNICDENTPEEVENMVRDLAQEYLDITKRPQYAHTDSIGILTNGFFDNQREFVGFLKSYGNVSLQTSLDSYNEETTDRNRGRKGVFAHVKSLLEVCVQEGLELSIQGHNLKGGENKATGQNYDYFNDQVYVLNTEEMFQLGNAVQGNFKPKETGRSHKYIGRLSPVNSPKNGWCDGFTAPETLHIRPTGNVGNCLYAYAVLEEFGSLHKKTMAEIVNGIQDSRVYQMFKDGSIVTYQHELDTSLFNREFSSSCEPIILTLTYGMIKEKLIGQGVRVKDAIQRANKEVAKLYKFIK